MASNALLELAKVLRLFTDVSDRCPIAAKACVSTCLGPPSVLSHPRSRLPTAHTRAALRARAVDVSAQQVRDAPPGERGRRGHVQDRHQGWPDPARRPHKSRARRERRCGVPSRGRPREPRPCVRGSDHDAPAAQRPDPHARAAAPRRARPESQHGAERSDTVDGLWRVGGAIGVPERLVLADGRERRSCRGRAELQADCSRVQRQRVDGVVLGGGRGGARRFLFLPKLLDLFGPLPSLPSCCGCCRASLCRVVCRVLYCAGCCCVGSEGGERGLSVTDAWSLGLLAAVGVGGLVGVAGGCWTSVA